MELFQTSVREQILPKKSESQQKLSDITQGVGEIKQQIRKIAITDAKVAKDLLGRMNNLEKMMDDVFPDLMNEIEGISKRLDNLNAEFFSKIFKDILQKELKEHGNNQSEEVKAQVNEGIKVLQSTMMGL